MELNTFLSSILPVSLIVVFGVPVIAVFISIMGDRFGFRDYCYSTKIRKNILSIFDNHEEKIDH